jgi:NAD(P)-dependent dehydrogenase (short-subunit alcohol dehydrogenase family)
VLDLCNLESQLWNILLPCTTGPGDARPTAAAIVADEKLVGKLSNKVILITGCSSGIGIETAHALHATGAHLFVTARDVKKGQEVVNDIVTSNSGVTAKIDVLKLDLDSLQSVRECASNFLSKSKELNILINNAGKCCLFHMSHVMLLPLYMLQAEGVLSAGSLLTLNAAYAAPKCTLE